MTIKRMKKYLGLIALALCMGFTACSDEDDIKAPSYIVNESGDGTVLQFDTLYLKVADGLAGKEYQWTVDGKVVSKASTYKFVQEKAGTYTIQLSLTGEDGGTVQSEMSAEVTPRSFSKGAFVLNEGNRSDKTGVLTYIDEKGTVIDSAYYRVNRTLLGNLCQDMFIANGKIYILSQNGAVNGGEGLLTVADAGSLKKVKVYNDEIKSSLSLPTKLAVVGNNIYIRDSKGLNVFNTSTGEIAALTDIGSVTNNRMVVIGDAVFMIAGSNILVVKDKTVVKTISAGGTVTGIAKSYDGQLWASSKSSNKMMKINPANDYSIDSHELGSYSPDNNYGSAPAFSAVKDELYFCQYPSFTSFALYRHNFASNQTEVVATAQEIQQHIPDAKTYYNSLGVNPQNGYVYLATLKGFGQDYKINDIAVFDFTKSSPLIHDYKSKNSFPAGVYFTYNFE